MGDGGASGSVNDGTPGLWEKFWLPLGRKIRQLLTSTTKKA